MTHRNILDAVRKHRVISILRGVAPEQVLSTAEALYAGGIRLLEITFAQHSPTMCEDTVAAIRIVREAFGTKMMVGAGTVLSCEQAEAAAEAGAEFLLSATCDEDVIRRAKQLGLGVIPGAMTPTEMENAHRWGADMVKVFPAGDLGLGYLKSVRAPLSHIPMIAVGGVNAQNLGDFLRIGMVGAGIGSCLANPEWIRQKNWAELTRVAADCCAAARCAEPKESAE